MLILSGLADDCIYKGVIVVSLNLVEGEKGSRSGPAWFGVNRLLDCQSARERIAHLNEDVKCFAANGRK